MQQWTVQLRHVWREANLCTDFLAKRGARGGERLELFAAMLEELTISLLIGSVRVPYRKV